MEADLSGLIEQVNLLKCTDEIQEQEERVTLILTALQKEDMLLDDVRETLANQGLLDTLRKLIHIPNLSHIKVAELIAELAKAESLRQTFVELNFVPALVKMLQTDDVAIATQACRALGNICYENDVGRNAVDSVEGVKPLLELLQAQLTNQADGADKLRLIACGFLLNLSNSHEIIQEKAIDEGALDLLTLYLEHYQIDAELCNMVLLTLASIADSEVGRVKSGDTRLAKLLLSLLESPHGDTHQSAILDLMTTIAENDDVKLELCQSNFPSILTSLIQNPVGETEEDRQAHIKVISDLIVILLTGDHSMEVLFSSSHGPVFIESVKWLQSDIEHLQIAGALAIGNFARNDDHCMKLVQDGLVIKLLNLLKKEGEPNISLQHGVLSALRNLAIPASNKPLLVQAGVIDVVLNLNRSEVTAVIFKLLGVLRMLVDGQEDAAKQIGCDKDFIPRVVEWCNVEEHAGVKGEATRLLAWLIKNSRSSEVMRNILQAEGMSPLVSMVTSEHLVMQNEALVALTLTSATLMDDASIFFKEAELVDTITTVLREKSTVSEILCNTLQLTKTLANAASLTTPQMIQCSLLACTGLGSAMTSSLHDDLLSASIPALVQELTKHEDERVQLAAQEVQMALSQAAAK